MKLSWKRSEIGVHHLVDRKSGKTVAVVVKPFPPARYDEEVVARTIEALWNEHEEGK